MNMRTGQILMLSVFLLGMALNGCAQHTCCIPEGPMPPRNDCLLGCPGRDPDIHPAEVASPTVSTVLNPEAPRRDISLQECLALALEHGRVGGTALRVLSYDPAAAYTAIEQGLAVFDARWTTSMNWSTTDERAGNVLVGIGPGAVINALQNQAPFISVDDANFVTRVEKPLPTGGVAGITFRTDYAMVNQPAPVGTLNPTYRPRLIFDVQQPLLRGFGTTVNQLPILISRLGFDQARENFYAAVNQMLFNVEQAYWNLYFSYWNLHTQDLALRQAHDAWEIAKQLQEKKLVTAQDLAALELQYQQIRLARLEALGGNGVSVLEAERQLRFVIGLPPEDGHRLIPTDMPTTAPYLPDWQHSIAAALENRPDLALLRQEVKKLQLEVKQAKNLTLPDLRAVGTYDINGLGNRLDGNEADPFAGSNNAFRSLASNRFNNWSVGLTLDVPIGFRAANAQLRRSQLALAQRTAQLRDQEKQATFALQQSFRDLTRAYEAVRIQAGIRKAATERYQALYDLFRAGLEGPNFLLITQQDWVQALTAERASIFAYNIALAKFELDKGTIQQFDNVSISDGPLPACVQSRASAHIHERHQALVLRQRPGAAASCLGNPIVAASNGPPPLVSIPVERTLAATDPAAMPPASAPAPMPPAASITAPVPRQLPAPR
ncbi:MAG: TolC family protein [Gemmataceae bacterium]|nr:TolC family protein [Gemmataceae bacterium]